MTDDNEVVSISGTFSDMSMDTHDRSVTLVLRVMIKDPSELPALNFNALSGEVDLLFWKKAF
jgi:hypothetical protein